MHATPDIAQDPRDFPNDEAASKLICLALRKAVVKLGPHRNSRPGMQHISLLLGDRMPGAE